MAGGERIQETDLLSLFEDLTKKAIREGRRIDLVKVRFGWLRSDRFYSTQGKEYPNQNIISSLSRFTSEDNLGELSQLEERLMLTDPQYSKGPIKRWETPAGPSTFYPGLFTFGIESITTNDGKDPLYKKYYVRGEERNLGQKIRNRLISLVPKEE